MDLCMLFWNLFYSSAGIFLNKGFKIALALDVVFYLLLAITHHPYQTHTHTHTPRPFMLITWGTPIRYFETFCYINFIFFQSNFTFLLIWDNPPALSTWLIPFHQSPFFIVFISLIFISWGSVFLSLVSQSSVSGYNRSEHLITLILGFSFCLLYSTAQTVVSLLGWCLPFIHRFFSKLG